MNLATIRHLGQAFQAVAGLSDHTLGQTAAIAAVALGAKVLEKHFCLRRSDGGPDVSFSAEPAELKQLAVSVREAEAALGQVHYGPVGEERKNLQFRRSIFVTRDVQAGETITRDNVRVIRPGHGLAPAALPLVLGRRFQAACEAGTPLAWALVG
jgi:sialic acid synthase SpsE